MGFSIFHWDNFIYYLQKGTDPQEEALTEAELGKMAEYIEPNNQERIAQILHPEEGSMMVAFLRAECREDIWGIGNSILQRWLAKNPPPGNRLVSTLRGANLLARRSIFSPLKCV